ncbi:MAG: hypothetical protein ACTSRZ_12920 [Promethearchaeota archaeon]
MKKKQKKPIEIPSEMPKIFIFKGRTYKIYKNLRRDRKRYIISLYKRYKDEIVPLENSKTSVELVTIKEKKKKKERPKVYCLTIFEWDERAGPLILGKFPEDFEIKPGLFMQIYANYLATNDVGLQSMAHENPEVITYYSGSPYEIFIILFTEPLEEPKIFENELEKICKLVTKTEDKELYIKEKISEFYSEFSVSDE